MESEKKVTVPIINQIHVEGMWGRCDIEWDNIDPHVNILVGPNGSGKSTFLRLINALFNDKKELDKFNLPLYVKFDDGGVIEYSAKKITYENLVAPFGWPVNYINTFDIPTSRKSEQSQLLQELNKVIYDHSKDNFSFFDYRMLILNFPKKGKEIQKRIDLLFCVIDDFFSSTGKRIRIDKETNKLVFGFSENIEIIGLEELSSGEKQLLLMLFTVFLTEEYPFILLMDEPEISLHIEWQNKLIEAIQTLNKNCQIILSTHSPSIFADGWGDKLVFMEDIMKGSNQKK